MSAGSTGSSTSTIPPWWQTCAGCRATAITHHFPVTLAQAEIGAKTNGTRRFRPLLGGLDLAGHVVTFDALHTVKDHLS